MQRQEVDPYEILGLKRGATWAEIRVAYRRLAKKHHPDKHPGDKASEWIFREVGRAYEGLRKVHGVHNPAGERSRREDAPGEKSDHRSERRRHEHKEQDRRERAERVRRERERTDSRKRWQRKRERIQTMRIRWTLLGVSVVLAVAAIASVTTVIYYRKGETVPDGAAKLAETVVGKVSTAQSRSASPARPFPGPVRETRIPRGASNGSSEPPRPSSALVDGNTVTGWRAASPLGQDATLPRTGENATAAADFTRGSHADDVLRIQGTPTGIDSGPGGGYETWWYGLSRVRISTGSRRVLEWSDSGGNLKVR